MITQKTADEISESLNLKCATCGKDMSFAVNAAYPGTNDIVITVTPCCANERLLNHLINVETWIDDAFNVLDKAKGIYDSLVDVMEDQAPDFFIDSKNTRLEFMELLEDVKHNLINAINELYN